MVSKFIILAPTSMSSLSYFQVLFFYLSFFQSPSETIEDNADFEMIFIVRDSAYSLLSIMLLPF